MLFTIVSGRTIHSVVVGLLCLAIAFSTCCSSYSVGKSDNIIMCLESERNALLQFKQGLVDESNVLASWGSNKDCCEWRGISCNNQTGHVITLNLHYNNFSHNPLSGEIVSSLLGLRYLNYLDLSFNDFGGMMIPKFIGSLSELKVLNLSCANFGGRIPPQLGNLSNLHTLDLSNLYTFDPSRNSVSFENLEWLSHLSSLRYLNMSGLDFSKVVNWPQSLSKLSSLIELQLIECSLPNVHLRTLSLINSSTSLQVLDLFANDLSSSIFYWIANVSSNFVHINLRRNMLQSPIPNVFVNMVSLVSLDLSNNQLEGGLPKSFQNFCRLESLSLKSNQFSENIEDSVKTLSCARNTLFNLDLSMNSFWGSCPDLTDFSKLRELDLSHNQLNGSVPESVGQLSSLEVLDLYGNSLNGVITEAHFLNLSRLRSLSVSGNHLSINLSSDWNPPFQLDTLLLSSCKLGPDFPKWIQTQRNLTSIDLSMNLLSGELPNCLMQFQELTVLSLGNNKLSGKVPSWLGKLKELSILRLHGNKFSGELPSLENCTRLLVVDLGANKLSGKIPTWIGQSLTNLLVLILRSNEFYGVIPLSMCRLTAIRILDLSGNKISGGLPHFFNNIAALSDDASSNFIDISSSFIGLEVVFKGREIQYSGKILGYLRLIDISSNHLVGEIPESVTIMKQIDSLNLSRNKLTGKVPEIFAKFNLLESLDLSRNQLSGRIPTSLLSVNFLSALDLSFNDLSGRIPVGTQLQSFNASIYMGNLGLCGPPLTKDCPGNETTQDNREQDNDGLISLGFLISTVLGFITGFWIVCGSLVVKSSWRYAYFKFLEDAKDWVYVKTSVYNAKMQRRLER